MSDRIPGGVEDVDRVAEEEEDDAGAPAAGADETGDHRVRVARERRERMRSHLLASVLHVCSAETPRAPAHIDDVVRHAGVSRGTFYKYFESLDLAVDSVAAGLGNEMSHSIAPLIRARSSAVESVPTGFMLWLIRGTMDASWAAFILRGALLEHGAVTMESIRRALIMGMDTADFTAPSIAIASDMLMGMMYEAMRHVAGRPAKPEYILAMAGMVLRGLGVPGIKTDKVTAAVYARLLQDAPAVVAWWRSDAGF